MEGIRYIQNINGFWINRIQWKFQLLFGIAMILKKWKYLGKFVKKWEKCQYGSLKTQYKIQNYSIPNLSKKKVKLIIVKYLKNKF